MLSMEGEGAPRSALHHAGRRHMPYLLKGSRRKVTFLGNYTRAGGVGKQEREEQ